MRIRFPRIHIQRRRNRGTNKSFVYTVSSKKSAASVRSKIAQACDRSTLHWDFGDLLKRLNQILAGWANYFRHGVSKRQVLHSRMAIRDGNDPLHRGLHCHGQTIPLPRRKHPEPIETNSPSTSVSPPGDDAWRARCGESGTSGSEGSPRRNPARQRDNGRAVADLIGASQTSHVAPSLHSRGAVRPREPPMATHGPPWR
ncbi:group II intron maturase-specific domain-containing protein [Arthrobacter sp. MMS18-M83]|uniref:group II intron maturase-specific domain-containing protein n=1 Tax=Arthrobacter sp. MMS18-M83 TaxID=2996261 RepID=UPI00227C6A79|nr:group II intron maturase-specific domain-containing protein [Arthrobacter sp. MMS18-M83]WAH95918.1 hypothetical protein OW521_15945 [Arthrobacter sp. MMS18-M83]